MVFSRSIFVLFGCAYVLTPALALPLSFPKENFNATDERLLRGDELFEAGFYSRAIAIYQELLDSTNGETPFQLQTAAQGRFHLALAFFSIEEYQKAIDLLDKNINANLPLELEQIRCHSLYLQALAYKNLQKYLLAKERFLSYLASPSSTFHDEALFELGFIDFLLGNYEEARSTLQSLSLEKAKTRLHTLKGLYLARIDLVGKRYGEAAVSLASLSAMIPSSDPLYFEICYLQGEAAFQLRQYEQALTFFKKSLPANHQETCSWYADAQYYLGWSYLKIGNDFLKTREEQAFYFQQAEDAFRNMLTIAPEEKGYLALAQCHLSRVNRLGQSDAYLEAEALLSRSDLFTSREAQAHALLLRAEAAPSYSLRDKFYRQLTHEENKDSSLHAKGWYMRALNDFEYGLFLIQSGEFIEGRDALQRAETSFKNAFALLKDKDNAQAAAALKYQALALSYSHLPEADERAFQLIETVIQTASIWEAVEHPDEVLYLHGYFAGRLAQQGGKKTYLAMADKSLKEAATIPGNKFGDIALHHLAALYYQSGELPAAEAVYLQLANGCPNSPYAAEAWFWSACCADRLEEGKEAGRERRRYMFEQYPHSRYAPEAYFTLYTYQEYLQGDRNAIKHLQGYKAKYPDTPFLIEASYLIGLDYKRDRKTAEGKWLRKKSWTDAIEAFHQAEAAFDDLQKKNLIPREKMGYYTAMKYRATLERAMANLAIADESQGAKRKIYLEYAEDVFKKLIAELDNAPLLQGDVKQAIYDEGSFGLAQTYIKGGTDDKADAILNEMLQQYQLANTARGYHLARTWDEKGRIAMRKKDYPKALEFFKCADEAAKGRSLSTDQRLDLWIQQSFCLRELSQFDDAILVLSKVVNDDAISSLRLKAMYLRAETYELQGRLELARKQLESMVKKGGAWARKAQEKLEKDYGY